MRIIFKSLDYILPGKYTIHRPFTEWDHRKLKLGLTVSTELYTIEIK